MSSHASVAVALPSNPIDNRGLATGITDTSTAPTTTTTVAAAAAAAAAATFLSTGTAPVETTKDQLTGHPLGEIVGFPIEHPTRHSMEKNLPGGGNWVVQKFGGTSVGKFPCNIAEIVRTGLLSGRIAVVCSALSNNTKAEGTTNRLLRAAREAEKPNSTEGYTKIVEAIRQDHIDAARKTVSDTAIADGYIAQVNHECDHLLRILESANNLEEVSVRVEDKIVSKGEKLSCLFMTAVLESVGVPAHYIDLSEVVAFGGADTLDEVFYSNLAIALADAVLAAGDRIPVITGYFGPLPGGLLNSVGRGYTDLCAALVAVGLRANELQIWKEVDGIFTADPRKVPTARLLAAVSPSEAAELTFYGSEVIHPFTMEQVIRARIPIRIKNVMNPSNAGTVIVPDPEDEFSRAGSVSGSETPGPLVRAPSHRGIPDEALRPKRPTAVTVKRQIVVLNVHSNKRTRAHGFLMTIFSVLDKWHLSVDLISSSEVHVSMALHSESSLLSGTEDDLKIQDQNLMGAVTELQRVGSVDLIGNMAIISLVGKQLRNMVGISGRFFSVLGDHNINIEMISQGASEINISCVIEERDADRALSVVHTSLFTFLD